ncbi:MAG TPA: DUF1998 domain-containing protein [Ohtaekwangia sp.]|nr:DUF1998 domain-containing protein [Ohtaekwangia sp.]
MLKNRNRTANEPLSKFKLLSAYGGPGSIIHTEYGSIIISCLEEWGFLKRIKEFIDEAIKIKKDEKEYVTDRCKSEDLYLSNDERLLEELKSVKNLSNLKYLALIPDVELHDVYKTIKNDKTLLAINSTFMPKGFFDGINQYKKYKDWFNDWPEEQHSEFFPPKKILRKDNKEFEFKLKQDNLVLICSHGHISDFPWSKYLRWRIENPDSQYEKVDLHNKLECCNNPLIQIKETSAAASGFDGKWLKCNNKGCEYSKGVSLKGLMSVKIKCIGHKPWEVSTGDVRYYFGKKSAREQEPITQPCASDHMRVALTTANNLYFSRLLSSIYMPPGLFLDDLSLQIKELNERLEAAMKAKDFPLCLTINEQIKILENERSNSAETNASLSDYERELKFRYSEYRALIRKTTEQINISKDLIVSDVTDNLDRELRPYFSRILRIDNIKVTSTQLDFARVEPVESEGEKFRLTNLFRSKPENIEVYPVVENYGEGIFFALNENEVKSFSLNNSRFKKLIERERTDFARGAVRFARSNGWQLYLVHSLCHLLMRELEFKCGYPTASLSERLYVSNENDMVMYGFMIYTAEGAEGSMGGLIAQTRKMNLNSLIKSALVRSSICNSDPLCWESEGQGLFELNLASCFSCSLVSETSCEQRNLYLDRRIMVDPDFGFFKHII